jgi:hypothetical protein
MNINNIILKISKNLFGKFVYTMCITSVSSLTFYCKILFRIRKLIEMNHHNVSSLQILNPLTNKMQILSNADFFTDTLCGMDT